MPNMFVTFHWDRCFRVHPALWYLNFGLELHSRRTGLSNHILLRIFFITLLHFQSPIFVSNFDWSRKSFASHEVCISSAILYERILGLDEFFPKSTFNFCFTSTAVLISKLLLWCRKLFVVEFAAKSCSCVLSKRLSNRVVLRSKHKFACLKLK